MGTHNNGFYRARRGAHQRKERQMALQPAQTEDGTLAYDPLLPRPYPYHVTETGEVSHQEFWGRGTRLIGFQEGSDQAVVLTARRAFDNPEKAVGLFPVFFDQGRGIYALTHPVATAAVTEN